MISKCDAAKKPKKPGVDQSGTQEDVLACSQWLPAWVKSLNLQFSFQVKNLKYEVLITDLQRVLRCFVQ